MHNWTRNDDIVACYLHRAGLDSFVLGAKEIARELGMSEESLISRVKNFDYIATGEGLSHAANASKAIFEEYKDMPLDDHKKEFIKIVIKK